MVKAQADLLVEHFEHDKTLFPAGSDNGADETWAKPEVWTDNATFLAGFDKAIEAADKLANVNAKADLGPALTSLGKEWLRRLPREVPPPEELGQHFVAGLEP